MKNIMFKLLMVNTILTFTAFQSCNQKEKEKVFYDSGELKFEVEVNEEGIPDGRFKKYYKNGEIKEKGRYKDGEREGIVKVYDSLENLIRMVPYKKGNESGIYKKFYKNGQMKATFEVKDGKNHGKVKSFYKDGTLKSIQKYSSGKKHGTSKFYYPNGQLKMVSVSDSGVTYFYKEYNRQGEVIEEQRRVSIQSITNDTLEIGERYKARVTLEGPLPEEDTFEKWEVFMGQDKADINHNKKSFVYESDPLNERAAYGFNPVAHINDTIFDGLEFVVALPKEELDSLKRAKSNQIQAVAK